MRHLTKIFLLLTVLILSLSSAAFAKPSTPNELEYVKAYETSEAGREFFRIEIGLKDEEVEYEINLESSISQTMMIDLDNTIPGAVARHSGRAIEYGLPAVSLTLQEVELGRTQLRVEFDKTIDDRGYRAHVEKANHAQKLPTRLMIDIDKYVFIDEEMFESEVGSGAIVIDPGHGGSDAGAIGPTGVREKDVALAVALKVKEMLEEQGDPVVMTRTTDRDVHSPQATNGQELQARVNKAPRDASMFISIHCNAFSNPESHGMETYFYTNSSMGRRLAKLINEELERYGELWNRGVKSANFYVLKHSAVPATLLELGFVTNPEEEQLLADEEYQAALARAIVTGINRYFGRLTAGGM